MHAMVWIKRIGLLAVCLSMLFSFGWVQPVSAQEQDPPPPVQPGMTPERTLQPGVEFDQHSGLYYVNDESAAAQTSALTSTGGPDYFGYTWNDSVSFSWVDASAGTAAGVSNNDYSNAGPVSLPFNFKFYENTYSQVYISRFGYLTFGGNYPYDTQSYLLNKNEPNDVIAPYWSPAYLGGSSKVTYRTFGSSPNRTFVVQWTNMIAGYPGSADEGEIYTYEAILYENGNIKFQYNSMIYSGGGYCAGVGIEDSRATDGLEVAWCGNFAQSGDAVLFTRPASGSRVLLGSNKFGGFAHPGIPVAITIPLLNTGDVGAEVYDLNYTCSWPVTFTQDGSVLTDTNSSGWPDTAPVAQRAWINLVANLQVPDLVNVGDYTRCDVWVVPVQNPTRPFYARLDAAVPAPFAQAYTNLSNGGLSLDITEPANQVTFRLGKVGYAPSAAEAPNGNLVYAWTEERYTSTKYVSEIYYAIRDRTGNVVKAPTRLDDLSGLGTYAYDYTPSIAVAPNGTIGITWYRYQSNNSGSNYNIHFARLNAAGTRLGATVNVTNLTTFVSYGSYNLNQTYDPVIAVTSDNNFLLAWEQDYNTSSGWVDNIAIAGYSTGGAQVRSPINITNDTAGYSEGFRYPRVTAVGGTKVMVVYRRDSDDDLVFQVRSSTGASVQAATDLTNDDSSSYEYAPDLVELSNGNILVAWHTGSVQYVVLNPAYSQVAAPQTLDGYGDYISVAADRMGHGIIQFGSNDEGHLWYALVNSSGTTLTQPVVSTFSGNGYFLSDTGGAITSHSMAPTSANTDLYLDGPTAKAAVPQAPTKILVNLGNLGAAAASTVTVTLTRPASISLNSIEPAANCVGLTCTWTFNNLGFLGGALLSFDATLPVSAPGTEYLLDLNISSPEADGDLTNNPLQIRLVSGMPLYLPALMK